MHHSTDFEEFLLVMHHVRACKAGYGIILTQKNRLLGADLLTHPAKNAADHIDIELLRILLDLGEAISGLDFARNDFDCTWRTNEFTELTRHATDAAIFVPHQGRRAAVMIGKAAVPFLLGILHGDLGAAEQHVLEVLKGNGQASDDSGQIQSLAPVQSRSWNGNGHGQNDE